MPKMIYAVWICIFTGLTTIAQDTSTPFYHYRLVKVKEGIYFSQRAEPLRHSLDGNFVIIINNEDVTVVDASGTNTGADQIIKDIRRLTKKPVRHLINTHYHGDHSFGNARFKKAFPQIEILATAATAQVINDRVKSFVPYTSNDSLFEARRNALDTQITRLKTEGADERVIANLQRHRNRDLFTIRHEYKNIVITPPTMVFDKSIILKRGSRDIQILFLGKGDTPGDAWVYLPQEKLLITGDAIPHPVPYGFTNTPIEWLETLEKAAQLDFDIMLPGHGSIQYDKKYLLLVIELLRSIKTQVAAQLAQGATLQQVKQQVVFSPFEDQITKGDRFIAYYFDQYFKQPIVQRFYDALKPAVTSQK
jgi:cyclase